MGGARTSGETDMETERKRAAPAAGLVAATLVVLACTAFLKLNNATASLRALAAAPDSAPEALRALVVFQVRDCETPRPWLRVFDEPGIRDHVVVSGVVVGRDAELGEAARRMEAVYRRIPMRLAGRPGARVLWHLGYRTTPYIVLLDAEGRVRFASAAPADPTDAETFKQAVRGTIAPLMNAEDR
jgi:hypothetical protein